eukprot:5741082-Prymnesium_polylepis.1
MGRGAGEGTGVEPAAGRTKRRGSAGTGRHGASRECAADNRGNTHAACLLYTKFLHKAVLERYAALRCLWHG